MGDNAAAVRTGSLNLMTTLAGDDSFAYDVHAPYHQEFMGCITDIKHSPPLPPQSCGGGGGCALCPTHAEHRAQH